MIYQRGNARLHPQGAFFVEVLEMRIAMVHQVPTIKGTGTCWQAERVCCVLSSGPTHHVSQGSTSV